MHGKSNINPQANEWETPKGNIEFGQSGITLNMLIKKFDLKLDPAATAHNTMCDNYYTIKQDGLKQDWTVNVIFNPPFSAPDKNNKYKSVIGQWVEKAVSESIKHKICVIGILPSYTGTQWFHHYVLDVAQIIFLRGRIRYKSKDKSKKIGSPNFDQLIAIWDAR